MPSLTPVTGIIQNVSPFGENCCESQISVLNRNGISHFIISADTYVAEQVRLRPGMYVSAFYDASLPVPLIYPPRYQAVIVSRANPNETIFAGYFDETLTAEEDALRLNIARSTEVITSNGQTFDCSPGNQILLVYYTETTRSIPPQTTPRKVIVMC